MTPPGERGGLGKAAWILPHFAVSPSLCIQLCILNTEPKKPRPGVLKALGKLCVWAWSWGQQYKHDKQLEAVVNSLTYKNAVLQDKQAVFQVMIKKADT